MNLFAANQNTSPWMLAAGILGIASILLLLLASPSCQAQTDWPQYETNPFVIPLQIPIPEDSAGGLIAADLNGDGLMDYLLTVPGHIAAYAHDGAQLWMRTVPVCVGGSSENEGLPGHHGAGVQVGDPDKHGAVRVYYLSRENRIHCIQGKDGADLWSAAPTWPEAAERWEHLVLANLRGKGRRDVVLQATNKDGYRMGRFLAAYALDDLEKSEAAPLWTNDDFLACAHNGLRIADLDADGKHEIYSGDILGPDGKQWYRIPLKGHLDSIGAHYVLGEQAGLRVVGLEEGGPQRTFLYSHKGLDWETDYQQWEPQNAVVGDFDPERPGLEIWNRSRYNEDQKPFVYDAQGNLLVQYELRERAPEDWTRSGVEVIWPIHWTGGEKQLAAAKERHRDGHGCIFDPMTGAFAERFPAEACRIYVADVAGDWREEVLLWNKNELRIYHNEAENPRPKQPRLWEQDHYRCAKMTWNYYSP